MVGPLLGIKFYETATDSAYACLNMLSGTLWLQTLMGFSKLKSNWV